MASLKLSSLLAVLVLSIPVGLRALPPEVAVDEDWSKSPEAYFLTSEERREWAQLKSRESRADFIERYWLKRDPSAGTPANEFRDLVRARIKTADARYAIGKKTGSRASQGYVFIVFGTPARVQQSHQAPLERPRNVEIGDTPSAVGLVEGNETTITWLYDRERTPKVLEALNIPSLQINYVIEPNRPRDDLQNPGLVHDYQEKLARKTIVNPDLVAAASASGAPAAMAPAVALAAPPPSILPLSPAVRTALEKAPPQGTPEDDKRPVFGTAVLWGARERPDTVAWIFLPEGMDSGASKLTVHALIRADDGGREVVTGSEPASTSTLLPTVRPGRVLTRHFDLAPGSYSASLAVTAEGDRLVASATVPLRVPELETDFAISSMLLSAGTSPTGKGGDDSFQIGSVEALPRADATFSRSESLWYFVQLANVAQDAKVTQELRLMRGPRTVAARTAPAELQEIAPGRYALGYELPLASLEPGTYVLYVTVRDGQGHSALRRADFRLLDHPTKVSSR
jgi:GWxTD domain-containing protein